eukprot:COSAG04_NODE_379_length_15473_cov_3.329322_2_plen_938_part_00
MCTVIGGNGHTIQFDKCPMGRAGCTRGGESFCEHCHQTVVLKDARWEVLSIDNIAPDSDAEGEPLILSNVAVKDLTRRVVCDTDLKSAPEEIALLSEVASVSGKYVATSDDTEAVPASFACGQFVAKCLAECMSPELARSRQLALTAPIPVILKCLIAMKRCLVAQQHEASQSNTIVRSAEEMRSVSNTPSNFGEALCQYAYWEIRRALAFNKTDRLHGGAPAAMIRDVAFDLYALLGDVKVSAACMEQLEASHDAGRTLHYHPRIDRPTHVQGLQTSFAATSRSTLVVLDNTTAYTLKLKKINIGSGSWPESGHPPATINPNERVAFGSVASNMIAASTEAEVEYFAHETMNSVGSAGSDIPIVVLKWKNAAVEQKVCDVSIRHEIGSRIEIDYRALDIRWVNTSTGQRLHKSTSAEQPVPSQGTHNTLQIAVVPGLEIREQHVGDLSSVQGSTLKALELVTHSDKQASKKDLKHFVETVSAADAAQSRAIARWFAQRLGPTPQELLRGSTTSVSPANVLSVLKAIESGLRGIKAPATPFIAHSTAQLEKSPDKQPKNFREAIYQYCIVQLYCLVAAAGGSESDEGQAELTREESEVAKISGAILEHLSNCEVSDRFLQDEIEAGMMGMGLPAWLVSSDSFVGRHAFGAAAGWFASELLSDLQGSAIDDSTMELLQRLTQPARKKGSKKDLKQLADIVKSANPAKSRALAKFFSQRLGRSPLEMALVAVQKAEKEGPAYSTEAEVRAHLGPQHLGYYEANGQFLRLVQGKRTWAIGKPNDTVTKVVDLRNNEGSVEACIDHPVGVILKVLTAIQFSLSAQTIPRTAFIARTETELRDSPEKQPANYREAIFQYCIVQLYARAGQWGDDELETELTSEESECAKLIGQILEQLGGCDMSERFLQDVLAGPLIGAGLPAWLVSSDSVVGRLAWRWMAK